MPEEELSWVQVGGALTIPVAVSETGAKGKPKARHLSMRFDLNREITDEPPASEHASDALIVIGYSPLKDLRWENDLMVVTQDGRLRNQEAWEACRNNRHADGRLLEWAEAAQGKNWAQRGWIFALPLRSFKDPESVDKHIIQPILKLFSEKRESYRELGWY